MFNTLLQRQCSLCLNRFSPVILKLSCSDSAVIKSEVKIKALVEENSSRVGKKDFQEHLVEKLFLNKLQETVLEYPQIDTIEEVDILRRHQYLAEKLITEKVEKEDALCETNSKAAVATLKKYELTGFKVPLLKRGFGYLNSEYTYMQEVLGLNPSLSKTVCEQEDFGIYLIDKFGSDLQKEQYLLKLASGEKIASFANIEKDTLVSSVPSSVNTSAVLSSDNQSYIISGTKCWVYNANSADLFILSANVSEPNGEPKPTLFLVDKNTPGIEIHKPIETVGLKNLSICDVTFNNIVVPTTSIIGDVCQGDVIIKNALSQGKLNNGGHCLAAMRKLLNRVIQHCIRNDFFNKDKHEMDYFRVKVASLASRMYVVESMTYLITGRLDIHNNADVFLESLIVKIYASETLQFFVKEVLEILGPEFFSGEDNFSELSKDSQFYVACDDANDYLRFILAYSGLNFAINYEKQRSFLQFLSEVVSTQQIKKILLYTPDKISYKHTAQGYLHRMFYHESLLFEDCLTKLHESTIFLIKKYKNQVFDRSLELRYLANMVINVYAMAATLGRASRAYCIGVKLQETDRLCAEIEIRRSCLRVREMAKQIKSTQFPEFSKIATSVMNSNKYKDVFPVFKNLTVR